ncbi:MAG: DUF401 family protein [Planctomycetota bacterium]
MVLLKIALVFVLIVLMLRLKVPFSISILFSGLILGIGFGLGFSDIGRSALATLQERDTISLSVIVGIILVLSELLEASGQLAELGQLIIRTFGLHRWTYTILPAIIGLLPMPGGALFTAPLMDGVSEACIPAHKKTLINYWFRHIWEYAWPLYPGLVLAAGLANVNLNTFSLIQSPFTVLSAAIGAILILPGIKILDEHSHKGSLKEFLRMIYLISPIIIIILLFVVFGLDMLVCLLAGLLAAMLNTVFGRRFPPKADPPMAEKPLQVLKIIFAKWSVYQMIFVVICVLVFSGIMRSSALIGDLSDFFTGRPSPGYGAAGGIGSEIPFIYAVITIIFLPFIVGLLTGLTVGFVGITFPLIFSTIVPNGIDVLPMAVLAYVSGVTGVMLSPVHLCLVLTNQYYNSSFRRVYKTLTPVALSILMLAIMGFLLYTLVWH